MNFNKKKILFVITKSNFGGAQRYVYELATRLPHDQFEVTVAFGGIGLLSEKLKHAGIQTYRIQSFERDINILKEIRSMFELASLIRTVRPDIIHLNSSKAGGTGALVARILGVPKIIFTAHGWAFNEARNGLWRSLVWILSWITALLSHAIIVVSAYDFRKTTMPFVKAKCHIIRTAVPEIDFLSQEEARSVLFSPEEQALHAHDFWLVSIAELTQNKNLLTAVLAVQDYNRTHSTKIFYTIIGEGELRKEIETALSTTNDSGAIKLTGYVTEARGLLKAFDALILPSRKEGMPYVILEAGAAGLVAIGSNVGGIPEIIEDGISGMLIDPKNIKDITSHLHACIVDSTRSAHLRTNLTNKIKKDFGIEKMLAETETVYQ